MNKQFYVELACSFFLEICYFRNDQQPDTIRFIEYGDYCYILYRRIVMRFFEKVGAEAAVKCPQRG